MAAICNPRHRLTGRLWERGEDGEHRIAASEPQWPPFPWRNPDRPDDWRSKQAKTPLMDILKGKR